MTGLAHISCDDCPGGKEMGIVCDLAACPKPEGEQMSVMHKLCPPLVCTEPYNPTAGCPIDAIRLEYNRKETERYHHCQRTIQDCFRHRGTDMCPQHKPIDFVVGGTDGFQPGDQIMTYEDEGPGALLPPHFECGHTLEGCKRVRTAGECPMMQSPETTGASK